MSTETQDQDFILSQRIRALQASPKAAGYFNEQMDAMGGMWMAGQMLAETPHGRIDQMPQEFLDALTKAEEIARAVQQ